ncbi:MAG: glycosyltransferase [Saprospiraceae bacterium]
MIENIPEVLLISSYPPRECGIATFSQDLRTALHNKFNQSFNIKICALEEGQDIREYSTEVSHILHTNDLSSFSDLAFSVNRDNKIKLVLIQHEFGFFSKLSDSEFYSFLKKIEKPLIIAFHTVLPAPDESLKNRIRNMVSACSAIIVMTQNSALILEKEYNIDSACIHVIAHGVHLVPHLNKNKLKAKYDLKGRKVLSTFGLISSGKSIETSLDALPSIISNNPSVIFLVIGKTHPTIKSREGEQYRLSLEAKVNELNLQNHVRFINNYLPLEELLEYLQLTDIYLFTSKDPNQAVSGTFLYAVSCACAIISTPIPHASEVLRDDAGILFDFCDSDQLSSAVNLLLKDNNQRQRLIQNGLQRVIFAAWENIAVEYAVLFKNCFIKSKSLQYEIPVVKLSHLRRLTTDFGMIQFSKINQPDLESGYTLDDNARALISMCMHFELFRTETDLQWIKIYLDFISFCLQENGTFKNYVSIDQIFTHQNEEVNLDDANGRAIWALGLLISKYEILPETIIDQATALMKQALPQLKNIHSTRAMAFIIKGMYCALQLSPNYLYQELLENLSKRLVQMYRHEANTDWLWFEPYLTYGNSILPEAMLCAWLVTDEVIYKDIACESMEFLMKQTFTKEGIQVVPNQGWHQKGQSKSRFGEQAIDVAYTILSLKLFFDSLGDTKYRNKIEIAFNWFLGQNHLRQIIYNPCTGGCYDGLEEFQVNLNQGAESCLSYLMARLAVDGVLPIKKTSGADPINLIHQKQLPMPSLIMQY